MSLPRNLRIYLLVLSIGFLSKTLIAQNAASGEEANAQASIPSVAQFGARADGQGDNVQPFQQAIHALAWDKSRGGKLFIPPGRYHFNAPLHIARGMVLEGASGAGRNSGTVLIFDGGIDGIVIDRTTTSDDGGGGDWTVIRDLAVTASSSAGNANGITLHARARIENVYVRGFGGNGVENNAQARGRGPNTNSNNWSMENVFIEGNGGHGFHAIGADSNAGVAIQVSTMNNGGWGFLDESFLGNTYVGCHTEGNKKGGYSVTNLNARSIFIGSYTEGGQPNNQINRPSMVIGGLFGKTVGSGYTMMDGWLSPNWTVRNQKDPNIPTTLGFGGDVPRGVLSIAASDGSLPYRLEYQKLGTGWWDLNYGELGNGTAISFSTNKADVGAGQVRFPNGLFIGQGANAHRISSALHPPTSGEHKAGDVVFSSDPDHSGYAGWIATRSGTPGEWTSFGAIVRTHDASKQDSRVAKLETVSSSTSNSNLPMILDASGRDLLRIFLHSDVRSSELVHAVDGQRLDLVICQDHMGGHVFHWPSNIRGGMNISPGPDICSAQSFVADEGILFATSPGAVGN